MDAKNKIEREMARTKKLIEDSENTMKAVPKHLSPSQELALEIFKKELVLLEQELMKLENKYESKNIYLDENEDEYMDLSNIRV